MSQLKFEIKLLHFCKVEISDLFGLVDPRWPFSQPPLKMSTSYLKELKKIKISLSTIMINQHHGEDHCIKDEINLGDF